LQIREVRPDEYEEVGELTITAYRSLPVDHLWGGYDEEIRQVAERVEGATVLVAVGDGRVLGSVTYVDDPASPWLEWVEQGEAQMRLLAVDPAERGRGVADALVKDCMRRASKDGRTRLVLHTTAHMEVAQRLYQRLGFVRTPHRDVHEYEEMSFLAYQWEVGGPSSS
jgi:ribosomal protein S18 acetylase RimI-like enzyme